MRTMISPFSNNDVIVDKLLGTAYDTVRFLVLNIETVQHVSLHMEDVFTVSNNIDDVLTVSHNIASVNTVASISPQVVALAAKLVELQAIYDNLAAIVDGKIYTQIEKDKVATIGTQATLNGTLGAVNSSINIALGTITPDSIKMVSIRAKATNNDVYFGDGVNLTYKIVGTNIVVTLGASAPAVLATGAVKVTVTYNLP